MNADENQTAEDKDAYLKAGRIQNRPACSFLLL